MFKLSKTRLETFCDGVIAIIITIMVLEIPLPHKIDLPEILELLKSIFIFLVSFFIVGFYWNQHHLLLESTQVISNMIIWRNLLPLAILSLFPIFTKWLMENPDQVVPAFAYDIVFFLVNFCYVFLLRGITSLKENQAVKKAFQSPRDNGRSGTAFWRWVMLVIFVALIILSTLYYPRVSLVLFLGLPASLSLFNLVLEDRRRGLG